MASHEIKLPSFRCQAYWSLWSEGEPQCPKGEGVAGGANRILLSFGTKDTPILHVRRKDAPVVKGHRI
jgi:hypothetical protein